MNVKRLRIPRATAAAFTALLAVGSMSGIARAQAEDGEQSRIRIGFEVAPVPLNMAGKDPALVGLASYYVNVLDHCNTCHSAGPATELAKGGNPYFKTNGGAVVNPATYPGHRFPEPDARQNRTARGRAHVRGVSLHHPDGHRSG